MRILMSGARGMVGTELRRELEARGDVVAALVRGGGASGDDVNWDPAAGTIDVDALRAGRFDAVVHLAGEPLLGRWTDDKRAKILDSRVDGTSLLARTIADLGADRPATFAVASATGAYGDRGDELLTDEAAVADNFLARVVVAWEAAAQPARDAGVRVVHVRMPAVQGLTGGALKAQLLPFKLGAGGRVGSGRQWMPWVGLAEVARMWLFALDTPELDGSFNAVGPTPARNVEYAKALGRALRRPSFLPAPVPIMKLALGGDLVDEMLLYSQKVVPSRLEGLGFEFADRTIDDTLRRELAR